MKILQLWLCLVLGCTLAISSVRAEAPAGSLDEIIFAVREPGKDMLNFGHWYVNFGHFSEHPEKWRSEEHTSELQSR